MLLLVLAGMLVLTAAQCSEERLSAPCGVVVDGSKSGQEFSAERQLERTLDKFLRESGCRRVVFGPIDGASEASICAAPEFDIDPDVERGNVDRQSLQSSRRKEVRTRSLAMLRCARKDPRSSPGSDVLGGLARIARDRPAGDGSYRVLVVSDFAQHTDDADLYHAKLRTPQQRAAIINRLDADHRIPDLSGIELRAAGFGALFSDDPPRMNDFRSFWTEVFNGPARGPDVDYSF
jgi:hypothetical protein